jgi:LysM repeat protein
VLITIIQQNGVFVKNKFAKIFVSMNYVKPVAVIMITVLSLQNISAQTNYVTHILKQGESLSALAKEYNTSVGDIMRMNGMHADTKLVYGSQIKIPSTKKQANVVVKSNTATVNTAPPIAEPSSGEITHIVAKGETLYSISKKYNVSVDQLRAWNKLADDNAKIGTLLIVNESGVNKLAATNAPKQKSEPVAAPQPQKEPVVESKPENKPAVSDNVTNNIQPVMETVNNMSSPVVSNDVSSYSGEGFFAPQFKEKKSKNMQNVSGISKTFKTASGWTDGKFYILANNIEPGTIVKITADNGNSVYAKVLWSMGDLKDNAGINFRISSATAAALHQDASSFNLNVSF